MENSFLFTVATTLIGVIITIGGIIWTLRGWLSTEFDESRDLIYVQIKNLEKTLVEKMEYHERHDDKRFAEVHNDIWDIRVRNAARDGLNTISNVGKGQ